MSEFDGIIKLLIEDKEYEIANTLKEKEKKHSKCFICTWYDSLHRKIVVLPKIIADVPELSIIDNKNNIVKIYKDDEVTISIR